MYLKGGWGVAELVSRYGGTVLCIINGSDVIVDSLSYALGSRLESRPILRDSSREPSS